MTDSDLSRRLDSLARSVGELRAELSKSVVGQDAVVEQLLIALLARGHGLLVGVPGLAKTLLVSSLASALDLSFNRVQFTPDLMPSDITGTDVLQEDANTRKRSFAFVPGPIFAHLVLADEINRAPPKTQSALLQAMQEGHVTAMGRTHPLPAPFFVMATQNPIEQEGTYPLPEAQLDRFLFQINMDYPAAEQEAQVLRATTGAPPPAPRKVLDAASLASLQSLVRQVPVADTPLRQTLRLVRSTRPDDPWSTEEVRASLRWGAGPRAGQALLLGAKARCLLHGRFTVSWEDVAALAAPALRHRLLPNYRAEAEGVRIDDLVARLVEAAGREA